MKLTKASALILIGILLVVVTAVAYAVWNTNFSQTLTVPGAVLALYRADGTTPIAIGSDQTAIWTWTGTQFTATVVLKNTGNQISGAINVNIPTVTGWVLTGVPSNGSVSAGNQVTIALTATPPSTTPTTTSGAFTITVSA